MIVLYDLIVLGGGPAGYIACERAGKAGIKTLLIEKNEIGGVCLNEGCIPTKTLLHSAKIYDSALKGEKYGVIAKDIVLNHETVVQRKEKVIKTLVSGVKAKLKNNSVKVVQGFGEIQGRESEGIVIKVDNDRFVGKKILIATGSVPIMPPVEGVQQGIQSGFVLTSKEILDLKKVPQSLVVIGGGVIGLEMAAYFNVAGSKVTVIEMLGHIGGELDKDVSNALLKNYQKNGIEIKLNSKVVKINKDSVQFLIDGKKEVVSTEKVLLSVGRKPQIENIGLEKIGVETLKGKIRTDSKGKTNQPDVYAAGDCTGRFMLAHAAYREAEVCVNNMLNGKDVMRYTAIPSVIYTNPEVAQVGLTEEGAIKEGKDFEKTTLSLKYSGRYVAENEGGDGFCKVIIDKKSRKILGVHIIGNYASEIIYGAAIMIEMEMRIKDVKEIVFPHPTVSEILREIAFEI